MPGDGARIARRCNMMAAELTGEAQRKRLEQVGRKLAPEVAKAVASTPSKSGTLADLTMSAHGHPSMRTGWHKIDIDGEARVGDNRLTVAPNRKALGPMRVLSDGRNAYGAGDKRVSGVRLSKRTNDYALKYRKVKGNVGATQPKGTWRRAKDALADKAPVAYAAEVTKSTARIWKG